LKGSTLRSDDSDNKKIYGKDIKHEDILHARVPAPSVAQPLIAILNKYSSVEKAD
jgi:lipid-binding SYLF domain-containing protein